MIINNIIYVYINVLVGDFLGGVDLFSFFFVVVFLIDVLVMMWLDGFVNISNIIWYIEMVNFYIGGFSFLFNVI